MDCDALSVRFFLKKSWLISTRPRPFVLFIFLKALTTNMSPHVTLISLLKRAPCRVNITQIRSFTKIHHHVKAHNLLSATRPHIRNTPRLIPSVVFQKHQQQWTSTTSTAPQNKTEERIVYNSWLDHLPAKIAPYAYLTRIDKPIGTWLLFWPCGKVVER
jgi:hypothetical protein